VRFGDDEVRASEIRCEGSDFEFCRAAFLEYTLSPVWTEVKQLRPIDHAGGLNETLLLSS